MRRLTLSFVCRPSENATETRRRRRRNGKIILRRFSGRGPVMTEYLTQSPGELTQLLIAWSEGDERVLEQLAPMVYGELRQLARRSMRRERAGHTLQTTALVHEAFLRLVGHPQERWRNRAHFYAIAAQMMRRILVDF